MTKTYETVLLSKLIPYANNPRSKIDEIGAGMYKGQKVTQAERHVDK